MRSFAASLFAVVFFATPFVACGGSGGRCTLNQSVTCACTNGQSGAQVCQADGTFTACTRDGVACAPASSAPDGGTNSSVGRIDFDVKFRPAGAVRAIDCQTAMVTTIRFGFFDQALDNLLRTQVDRPCVPGERYRVSIDPGPYNIRVQGLNGQLTICYETNQLYTVQTGNTDVLTFEAQQSPSGAAGGCTYPSIQR